MLDKRRILVGITGGIAAYKVPQLIRLLKKQGADVKVVCTPLAAGFVGEETLAAVSGYPSYRDGSRVYDMDHIRLAQWAETFLICPATANTIAKIAHGICDNLLTTLALSIPSDRIVIAPAMNTVMWDNVATQANILLLKERGLLVLPVGEGELACGTSGAGRMLSPDEIVMHVSAIEASASQLLKGKKVLISSGPTEEQIDPVRVITNKSSGKMGAALARSAFLSGASVTVVTGPAPTPLPHGVRVIRVASAIEMQAAMTREFVDADICVMAAAVCDYRPVVVSSEKIKRDPAKRLILELEANPDIAAQLGAVKGDRFLVGFALESDENETSAHAKLVKKGCDMIVLNTVGKSLCSATTQMTFIEKNGQIEHLPVMDKMDAACAIFKRIVERIGSIDAK